MREENLGVNGSSSNAIQHQIVFGSESLSVLNKPNIVLRQPIKYGLLNISRNYSEEEIINDLEKITEHIIYDLLGISGNDLKNYSVILCAPDKFHRGQYKSIINMLMRKIGFGSFFIHIDSVLATFGACQSIACVVDIGHTHITISCVDEGIVVTNSCIKKHFGGEDVNHVLISQLTKNKTISSDKGAANNPTHALNIQDQTHSAVLEILRKKGCILLETAECPVNVKVAFDRNPETPVWTVDWGSPFVLAPSMLFHESVMNLFNKKSEDYGGYDTNGLKQYFNYKSEYFEQYLDEEDYFDETEQYVNKLMMVQSQSQTFLNKEEVLKACDVSEADILSEWAMVNLEDAIAYSILQLKDSDSKKKAANQIILTGGFAQTPFLLEELEDRLIERISVFDSSIERVEVINCSSRELNPGYLSWIGASVIPKLECMKEGFIGRDKWIGKSNYGPVDRMEGQKDKSSEFGVTYMKEKLAFQW